MLILPTGTGGILYRPRFFHEIVFDPMLRQVRAGERVQSNSPITLVQ